MPFNPGQFIERDLFTYETDALAKVEIIKENRRRKEAGLELLSEEEKTKIIQEHKDTAKSNEEKTVDEYKRQNPKITTSKDTLLALLSMFSNRRQEAIVKASEFDNQRLLIMKPKSEQKKTKIGEKPNALDKFKEVKIYYSKLPWKIYEDIQKLQGEIADIARVRQMTISSIDDNGKVKEAVLQKNDFAVTNMSDSEFAQINSILTTKQRELYRKAGEEMYSLEPNDIDTAETLTLSLAIEAGLYRLQYGFPADNPNSIYS
jgi:hypothetical protein